MFDSFVLKWERNSEVTFNIFLVSLFQLSVLESYRQPGEIFADKNFAGWRQ